MNREFPKLLIVGHYPGGRTGFEITLRNLLGDWPPERLAVAANADIEAMQSNQCRDYYALGQEEISTLPVLRLFYRTRRSEHLSFPNLRQLPPKPPVGLAAMGRAGSALRWLLLKTGLYFSRLRYTVSAKLLDWIEGYDPDIILTMPGDVFSMELVMELKRKTGRRVAIYILDDWVHAIADYSWFPRYWGHRMDAMFRQVVEHTDVHLAICQKMADEYTRLYGKQFLSFHNPVDVVKFGNNGGERPEQSANLFTITYIGKINRDTEEGISDMIAALEGMDENVVFQIYGRGGSPKLMQRIGRSRISRLMPYAAHEAIPGILQASSLVFIPLGFSALSRKYTRLSMSTKASEAMASGTPVLVYAPDDIAMTEYAIRDRWALVVNNRSVTQLKDCILTVLYKRVDIAPMVERARSLALEKHSTERVREALRQHFCAVLKDPVV